MTLIISTLLCFSVSAEESGTDLQDASITYAGIKMVVDGATIVPKGADGQPAEPFLYNDTTYLPLRALATALGLTVDWEDGNVRLTSNSTETPPVGNPVVSRGTRQVQLAFSDTKLELDGRPLELKNADGTPAQPLLYDNTLYLPIRALSNALNVPIQWDAATSTVYLGDRVTFLLSSEIHQDLSNGNVSSVSYTYDEQNQLTKTVSIDQNGRETIVTYTYDEDGILTSMETTVDQTVTARMDYLYEYDQKGNCIKETSVNQDGAETVSTRMFDSKGNCVSEIVRSADGTEISYGRTYDDFGNLLTQRRVSTQGTETQTYTYNESGQIDTYLYETEIIGTPLLHLYQQKTFDENGLAVSSTVTDERRSYQEEMTFAYDEYGNLVSASSSGTQDIFTYLQIRDDG